MIAAWISVGVILLVAVVSSVVTHEERKRRHLGRYRPTPDNRWRHRDEFKVFMRDVK